MFFCPCQPWTHHYKIVKDSSVISESYYHQAGILPQASSTNQRLKSYLISIMFTWRAVKCWNCGTACVDCVDFSCAAFPSFSLVWLVLEAWELWVPCDWDWTSFCCVDIRLDVDTRFVFINWLSPASVVSDLSSIKYTCCDWPSSPPDRNKGKRCY